MAPARAKMIPITLNRIELWVNKKASWYKVIPKLKPEIAPSIAEPNFSILIMIKPRKSPMIVEINKDVIKNKFVLESDVLDFSVLEFNISNN